MRVANIQALSPKVTPWKNGQELTASSWSSIDSMDDFGTMVRTVKHYSTAMVEFVENDGSSWFFNPLSVGWASMTDQKYTSVLAQSVGSPLRLKRDQKGGGPRWVNTQFGNLVATADGSGVRI